MEKVCGNEKGCGRWLTFYVGVDGQSPVDLDKRACLEWSLRKPEGCTCDIKGPEDGGGFYLQWIGDDRCPRSRNEHNAAKGMIMLASF